MTAVNNTLMRGLGSGLSAWLDTIDPNGIFARMQGWYAGYYDANNNSVADANEACSFFSEIKGGDGKIYVLRLTPTAGQPGHFDLTVSLRDPTTGSLTVVDPSRFSDSYSALRSGANNFTLSIIDLNRIDTLFSQWCRDRTADVYVPVIIRNNGSRFDQEGFYAGWGYGDSEDRPDDTFVEGEQGRTDRNSKPGAIGGFGGGMVWQEWDGSWRGHWVTAGEAYERCLFADRLASPGTDGYETNFYQEGGGPNDWIAAKNGLQIVSMAVNVNGVETTTMGFTYRDQRTGYDVTVYWDPATQTNMIGTVKNGTTDITEQVVRSLGGRAIGRTWTDIRARFDRMPLSSAMLGNTPNADPYNYAADDQYSVISQTGMVTPPSGQESAALARFKTTWSQYIVNGVLTRLPANDEEAQRLHSDVLALMRGNPGDLLRLFCGVPGSGNDVRAGMSLMSNFFSRMRSSTTSGDLMVIAEAIGRLTYLAGIQLARAGRRDAGSSGRSNGEYYFLVQTGMNSLSNSVIGNAFSSPLDIAQRKQLSQHYLLGLMNYDPATGRQFASTPEEAINVLVEHLRRAGALDTNQATRKTALDLSLFVRSVIQTLVLISELRTVDPGSDIITSMLAMINNVASTENYAQFLSTAFFGQLAAICSESSDARKYFEDQQGVQYEYSRKIQDAITTAFERALRAKGDAIKAMCSRN